MRVRPGHRCAQPSGPQVAEVCPSRWSHVPSLSTRLEFVHPAFLDLSSRSVSSANVAIKIIFLGTAGKRKGRTLSDPPPSQYEGRYLSTNQGCLSCLRSVNMC